MMREISLLERQLICLDILKFIDEFCRNNDIHYSLTGGTLLGAVRHKGFIPWDDDIDIFMTRPEFEKFDSKMKGQKEYTWLTREYDSNYFYNFGRVVDRRTKIIDEGIHEINGYGVFVDVCIVDGLPDNRFTRKCHIILVRIIVLFRRLSSYSHKEYIPKNPLKRLAKQIASTFARTIGVSNWCSLLERIVKKYPFDGGKYVGNIMSQYGAREIMHKTSFDDYIAMSFEGEKFEVIQGWEEYLSNIYGNYMEFPPVEKQVGHHLGKAFWIDERE